MILQLALVVASLVTYFYYKTWKKLKLWSSMGLDEDPGSMLFGSPSNAKLMTQAVSFNDYFDGVYEKFRDKKIWGQYGTFGAPCLIVNDLDLMKDVLIKDFDHFPMQRDMFMGSNKYVNDMLIVLGGDRWKAMRSVASPIFTSGKLKGMLPLIQNVGDQLVKTLDGYASKSTEFECKELFTRYAIDVVATTGFGVEGQALENPKSVFKDQVDRMMSRGKYEGQGGILGAIKMTLGFTWPDMARLLNLETMDSQAIDFFVSIIKATLKDRQKTGNKRNDFIDALLAGITQSEKEGGDGTKIFKTQEDLETALVANGLVLFFGGFDTSSTTTSAIAWFLVNNPHVQEALYNEVKDAIDDNNGSEHLDYDTIQGLPYLEGVIMETLRCYPLGHLERTCAKEYTFRGTNVTIKPGTLVQMPTVKMMKDEKYYEDPLNFDPTRWSKDSDSAKNPFLLFTFGHGPRNCIGKRFAILQMKMSLVRLVANYKLVASERTPKVLKTDPKSFSLDVLGGVWVKAVKRD